MKSYFIKTLGCEKNTVDSECAAAVFENCGLISCDNPSDADYILVVTCGFILDAKEQSIESIFDMIRFKKDNSKLIVAGCLTQRYAEELVKELPEVDYFLGVDDYEKISDIVSGSDNINLCGKISKTFVELPRKIISSYSACIKIAEGCNNVCSYCAIPFMKGRYRSRAEDNILKEAKELAKKGVKELIIIAQDVTAYGKDLKLQDGLSKLLHKLCRIEGIEWIRLMYCYEDEITDDLIECMKSEPKICHYIDIPIQHCNDNILKSMNRKSTHFSIEDTVRRLRSAMPDICIRTTLICGLPGEKSVEFNELYDFVNEVQFTRLGCFAYSKEEGTKAASMKPQVRSDVKERRKDLIMELQREISLNHNRNLIGKTLKVLVDREEEPGLYIGRSYMDAPEIDNEIMFKAENISIGEFYDVKIIDAFDYDLSGELIC